MNYSPRAVAALLRKNNPIAICDGSPIWKHSIFENYFAYWLYLNGLDYTLEAGLYDRRNFDLSLYKTIIFNSIGGMDGAEYSRDELVNSFSPKNLKLIIVGSESSYYLIKDLAKKLKIQVVGGQVCLDSQTIQKIYDIPFVNVSKKLPTIEQMWKKNISKMFFEPEAKWAH